jgi:phosphoribosylformimino-5-aminoimidazole carboxamide ribotide isomerase
MELLPAIDLHEGRAVRLVQGDFDRSSVYGDPEVLARSFVDRGARWLHVVDLDAARSGAPVHRDLIKALARSLGVPVQTGGGVRTLADVADLVEAGLARVVLGTAALEDPDLAVEAANRFPGRVALGIDYRRTVDGRLEAASHGWAEGSGRTVGELLAAVAGAPLGALVVTAIARDGTLSGPDIEGLAAVLDATDLAVVASGGVGSAADVAALARVASPARGRTLAGAVVGKALVDGRMSVEEGLAACAASG